MSKIFQVLSNIKHNGDLLAAGTFLEGELSEFGQLVESKVLRVMEGAKSLAHAVEMAAADAEAKASQTASEEAAPNTWGPKAEAPEAPKEPEKPAAPAAEQAAATDGLKPGEVGAGDVAPVTGDNL